MQPHKPLVLDEQRPNHFDHFLNLVWTSTFRDQILDPPEPNPDSLGQPADVVYSRYLHAGKRRRYVGGCLQDISIALALRAQTFGDSLEGRVVGIADGGTITVLDDGLQQHKVRLGGIDEPEEDQAFGNFSKRYLSDLVRGLTVWVEYEKRDRYGRILGKVWV